MKRKLLGTFSLGLENVRIFADHSTGDSECRLYPADNGCATMTIGCCAPWHRVLGNLMHEAMEFRLHRQRSAWEKCGTLCEESGRYLFIMSHVDLDEVAKDIGYVLDGVYSKLKAEYDLQNAKKEVQA